MCDCGFENQRVFQAKVHYSVYGVDVNNKILQTTWINDEIVVCLACGETSDIVPEPKLDELRLLGGEPLTF